MTRQISVALAAGVLMAGITAVSAAGAAQPSNTSIMSNSGASSNHNTIRGMLGKRPGQGSDALHLSRTQRRTAWNDLRGHATDQQASSGFKAKVGAVVPSTISLKRISTRAARDVPALRPYDFALVNGKLLVVNPSDKKVAEAISETAGS